MDKITNTEIRMYKMGTGDCFALRFMSGDKVKFKMLIDSGTWSGSKETLTPYIEDLLAYLDHHVNVLVVTHEHKDHVHAFDVCKDVFLGAGGKRLKADEVWMGWTENDKVKKVKEWKEDYGEKKMALALASQRLSNAVRSPDFAKEFESDPLGVEKIGLRRMYADSLQSFADLHFSLDGEYKGGLKGMDVVKKDIASPGTIKYLSPGKVMEDLPGAEGIKFYILGPPEKYDAIKKEKGKAGTGESYDHNDKIEQNSAFAAAVLNYDNTDLSRRLVPFDTRYLADPVTKSSHPLIKEYTATGQEWRKIDHDWLFSAGSLALRMNSKTNNLSLAMAIEFEESGRVMLFPGDAEFGSWSSWHDIKWSDPCRNGKKHLTEDLLSRTVFYKVAHHLSHNGTARKIGLEMMEDKNLVAMATLDYNVISEGWTGTMPNRDIVRELLTRTKGRLMVMNTEELYLDFNEEEPLKEKIKEARRAMNKKESEAFKKAFGETDLYIQFTVTAK